MLFFTTYLNTSQGVLFGRALFLILTLLLSSLCSSAQALKLGVVESEYILELMPEAQTAQRDIDAFARKLANRLSAMRQGLAAQTAQLEQEQANLSDSARAEREKELQTLQQDILQEQQTAQGQVQFKEMQMLSPLRQRVQQTVDSVAQVNGYTHIFSTAVNGQSTFLYTQDPEETDVTPLVVEALGLTIPADTVGQ